MVNTKNISFEKVPDRKQTVRALPVSDSGSKLFNSISNIGRLKAYDFGNASKLKNNFKVLEHLIGGNAFMSVVDFHDFAKPVVYPSQSQYIDYSETIKSPSYWTFKEDELFTTEDLLAIEISNSEYIFKLGDNWDDNNSIGYTYENWLVAIGFLKNFFKWMSENLKNEIHIPKIYHGPNGSIDIIWEQMDTKIYINIDNNNNLGTFYSYYNDKQKSSGEFELNDFDFKILPLPIKF